MTHKETHKEQILKTLSQTAVPVCDDCLAKLTGISPRQTVYQNCSNLANKRLIMRGHGECAFCAKKKIVSWTEKGMENCSSTLAPANITQIKSSFEEEKASKNTFPWYWEGNVQSKVVAYLAGRGYFIRSVTDTASRAQGKDIVAVTPEGKELWVSVKGFPENNSYTQARHYFAEAVFDVVLYRSENPEVELALALPHGFSTYERLALRISWLRKTLPLKVYWVDESGDIRAE
ncbi:hypothetical protein [Neomoorella mulderi]|uniref:Protein NO VEIN C-terminal domain-containing protein n=1 Tax=Moorella mulderi DSM 14980 TaxID=1122241 RepID=A0A151ASM0_9FIRM|nr:hypothetical protein [Moorella mulderi]KYH30573.1 hypothetical protein MOMUL_30330 [Moorella mulderi DSM 14980]